MRKRADDWVIERETEAGREDKRGREKGWKPIGGTEGRDGVSEGERGGEEGGKRFLKGRILPHLRMWESVESPEEGVFKGSATPIGAWGSRGDLRGRQGIGSGVFGAEREGGGDRLHGWREKGKGWRQARAQRLFGSGN